MGFELAALIVGLPLVLTVVFTKKNFVLTVNRIAVFFIDLVLVVLDKFAQGGKPNGLNMVFVVAPLFSIANGNL